MNTDRLAALARTLDLAPRAALLVALRRARGPQAGWSALLADTRCMHRSVATDLFATPVAEYAQGETLRALALLFARDGT
ncbi:hypothetical protein [Dokdonella sp.]|uniref:hypothetical protein n=1 Tax=Dokdonella sp. TaxID=2291710 RepID=UPI0037852154